MRKAAWVISPPTKGSGGFRTICSKARYLDLHGFECHFFILPGAESYKSASQVADEIVNWYGYEPKSVCIQALIPDCFDVAIATAWNTAEYVAMQSVSFKLYFIQDFEPWFYPVGENYLCAEHSYLLDLMPITIGRWLSNKVSNYYSDSCFIFAILVLTPLFILIVLANESLDPFVRFSSRIKTAVFPGCLLKPFAWLAVTTRVLTFICLDMMVSSISMKDVYINWAF